MQRLVFVVVVALLGGVALAGCGRSEPDVAAYVGKQRFTIQQVETLAKEVGDRVGDYSEAQRSVLGWLVIRSLGERMKDQQGLKLQAPEDIDGFAAQSGLKAGSPVARLYLEMLSVVQALQETVTPVDPTVEDQEDVYGNLRIDGEPVQQPFDAVQQFLTRETIGRPLAVRQTLAAELGRSDFVVNPRYTPVLFRIDLRIGQVPGFVNLPLGAGSVASGAR